MAMNYSTHKSIVYTNENCVGCNRCIKVCRCVGANVTTEVVENGKFRIEVDGSRCISCGACFEACEHNAREYCDDTDRFFEDLRKGEQISVLIAPSFRANYPDEYEKVLGGLKALGANRFINVAFGADITAWAYIHYLKKHGARGSIAQPCPPVVSYIEKYRTELIDYLMPIQSPLMCAATYARKEMGITDKLAFISPCIGKRPR